ncbi:type I polyketide synthase [uncultured Mycolicibacterium sp.]|uniref:type I polyketide synthase n=1 Tax=uncultured Mycolicibacterium sp. TaxID=2320817 RepID=UPI002612BBE8|nr:type I polyketide synthase [uncultured Mycolicibacterium sp.]
MADTTPGEPVAIIGVGCRLGGGVRTPEQFWDFLLAGGSDVREVPAHRWEPYLRRDPRNAAVLRETTPWGTFLDDLDAFDAEFFGVSPREAELMDPQQRLALEVSWEALEHAGVPPRSLAGSDTAVLMGVNSDDYGRLLMEDLPGIEAWTGIGTSLCGVANRVSHLLDLRGPSVALDAACAASLVAVHQACQLLRDRETALALAGGVSALIGPGLTRVLDRAGATAPDGRCKSFDAAADGYGRGEGAAVVVLKRLADARRDGDRVIAVIRGGAVAQDGRTVGIMSPNGAAQADLFRRACRVSGIEPGTVDFVEAHGTGTPTGDPVELAALAEVYGAAHTPEHRCRVGSVKPNTGHLEGGAGVVGLIKAALALRHGVIPPTAGVRTLTPAADWAHNNLHVPTTAEPFPRRAGTPRRAAVCSYGYGGTIAHVLLEEAPAAPAEPPKAAAPLIFPLSARSEQRLARQAAALRDHLAAHDEPLTAVAATLWHRRGHDPVRAAVVAADRDELLAGLTALADGAGRPGVVTGTALAAAGPVWVFSGHGSHWPGMGRQLLAAEPAFAAVIDEIEPVFAAELGFSPRQALHTGELGGTDRVQALTFAVQAGLAAVLRERGVTPAAVIGHSVGEVAACVAAGVFDLAQGAAVACYRARGFRAVAGQGAMALVRLSFAEAEALLAGRTDVVAAISASPVSTVLSGTVAAVEAVCAELAEQGVPVRRVNTDVAFHSPAMDGLTDELGRLVAGLAPPKPPALPLYSTALVDPRSPAPRDRDYWVTNLRGRVRFAEAVAAAAADGHRLFLEVSAHPVVAHSIAETLALAGIGEHAVLPLLRRDRPELPAVAAAVAGLHCHGAPVDPGVGPRTPWADGLPGTVWQHRRFWRTPGAPPGLAAVHDTASHTLLGGCTEITGAVPARVWQTRLDRASRPYPGDHPVRGTEIVPAAVLLHTFLTAAGTAIADVRLRTPVAPARTRDIQVVLQDGALSLASRLVDDAGEEGSGWLTHCTARVAAEPAAAPAPLDEPVLRERCRDPLPPGHVVGTLAELGVAAMGFGWQIIELQRGDDELLARVAAEPDASAPPDWAGLIDAATSTASTIFDGPPRLRMPSAIERVDLLDKPPAVALLHVRRRPGATVTDVAIAEESGAVAATLTGLAFEELEQPDGGTGRVLHRIAWHPVERPAAAPARVVLVGGDGPTRDILTRDLAAAGVAHEHVGDPADLTGDPGADAVVLVLPRADALPAESAWLVLRTLQRLLALGAAARLWALTRGVHEGDNPGHAPLWGLARVAAAEHPRLWGGVLDLDADRLPVWALNLSGHGVVVVRDDVAHVARLAPAGAAGERPLTCSPGGTYLITGGTGALGLRVAHRLADLGARRLVLVSRSGLPARADRDPDTDPVAAAVAALEQRGVTVTAAACDVGAPGAAATLRRVLADLPPVRGVVHAAGVESGALLADTGADDLAATMRPKVDGALMLHELFPPGVLDWMVLFSSCGYLAGFPGQGAYACGNAFLDALARHRRARGDRTTAVAWTAWRGLGMGSTSEFVAAQLEALGMGTIGAEEALRALDAAVRAGDPNPVVLPVLPAAAAVPVLADIAPAPEAGAAPRAEVPGGGAELERWAAEQVIAAVAAELGLPEAEIDPRQPLVELGVDSIMTVALRRALERRTGLALPPTLLWEHPTAAAVTDRVVELLRAGGRRT